MKIFLTILISLFLVTVNYCQDIYKTYEFAVSKFESDEFEIAIETLQRVYFFDPDNMLKAEVSGKLAECYFNLGDYKKSNKFLDLALNLEVNDSIKNALAFKKVLNLYFMEEYKFALVELFGIADNLNISQERSKQFYFGLMYYKQEKYIESEKHFNLCFEENDDMLVQLETLFNANDNIKKNWSYISQYMSMLIPGSGQLANGETKSALNSFVLTTSLLLLYSYTAINYTLTDAVMSVLPWFMRYHRGGYENTFQIALNKQTLKRNRILSEIISLYQKP